MAAFRQSRNLSRGVPSKGSRAGLLTGRYQQRFGHECNPLPGAPAVDGGGAGLPLSETTMADVLRAAGYKTSAIGKWHLGDQKEFWPNRRGFDEWFGFSGGGLSYWGDVGTKLPASMGVHRGDEAVDKETLTYLTDDFSTEAVNFVDRHHDKPFFLYLSYNAPHAPDHATKHHLAKKNRAHRIRRSRGVRCDGRRDGRRDRPSDGETERSWR